MDQVKKATNAAWGLFKRFGVRSVSMDDVAREVCISKKTLYQCFKDKNELIVKTLDIDLMQIQDRVNEILNEEKNPVRQVIRISRYVTDYLKDINPSMIYDLQKYHPDIHEQFVTYRQQTFYEKVRQNLREGIEQGYYLPDLDIDSATNMYLCLMNNYPQTLINAGINPDYTRIYDQIVKYHLQAITTKKGMDEAKAFNHEIQK